MSRFAGNYFLCIFKIQVRGGGIRSGDCSSPPEIIKWNATQIAGGESVGEGLIKKMKPGARSLARSLARSTNYEMPAPTLSLSLACCNINFWRRVPLSPKIVQSATWKQLGPPMICEIDKWSAASALSVAASALLLACPSGFPALDGKFPRKTSAFNLR